jgi:hypothetical protein
MVPMISSKEKRFLLHGFIQTLLSVSTVLSLEFNLEGDDEYS